jgi:hypothetical protein
MVVTSWCDQDHEQQGRRLGAKGDRVEITKAALDTALEAVEMDLIMEVAIRSPTSPPRPEWVGWRPAARR